MGDEREKEIKNNRRNLEQQKRKEKLAKQKLKKDEIKKADKEAEERYLKDSFKDGKKIKKGLFTEEDDIFNSPNKSLIEEVEDKNLENNKSLLDLVKEDKQKKESETVSNNLIDNYKNSSIKENNENYTKFEDLETKKLDKIEKKKTRRVKKKEKQEKRKGINKFLHSKMGKLMLSSGFFTGILILAFIITFVIGAGATVLIALSIKEIRDELPQEMLAGIDFSGLDGNVTYNNANGNNNTNNNNNNSVNSDVPTDKTEFLSLPINTNFGVNEDKMISDFLASSGRASATGITTSEHVKKMMAVIKSNGMSPEIFLAYELQEGYTTPWGWNNYTNYTGDPYGDADFVSKHHVEVSNTSGAINLAWVDGANSPYSPPADVVASGNEFASKLPSGTIGRMYLAGTAAAVWGSFYPEALNASVNGVQNYGDPVKGVMDVLKSWGAN